MTTLGVLALLLFAQVPQGRVCATSLGSEFHVCGAWQPLEKANEMRDTNRWLNGAWFEFEVEVR